jgi:signal peptidase I
MSKGKLRGLQKKVYIIILIVIIIILLVYIQYASRTIAMLGGSMEPTIGSDQPIIVDYGYYNFNPLSGGDIVAVELKTLDYTLVMRTIAVPGDSLELSDGRLLINGNILDESYIQGGYKFSEEDLSLVFRMLSDGRIPESSVMLLNDNRDDMYDSRHMGLFPVDYVKGKVII